MHNQEWKSKSELFTRSSSEQLNSFRNQNNDWKGKDGYTISLSRFL